MNVAVERFTFFSGAVELIGQAEDVPFAVRRAELLVGGMAVAKAAIRVGDRADAVRFHVRAMIPFTSREFHDVSLKLIGRWGKSVVLSELGVKEVTEAPGHALFGKFLQRLSESESGAILEIGARARSGTARNQYVPEGWDYTGFDIVAGKNVDVIGDAHRMSSHFPNGHFHAAMSMSVFEHLAMPWKVAVELGKVMAVGGLAYIQTHQTFPCHDEPWDFWRISKDAWPALFNRYTGFEILEAAVAEPAFVVPHRWHPGVNHGDFEGWSLSSVLIRKICEPVADWPVPLSDLVTQNYPG